MIHLLLGRHGARDHYLGGRFRSRERARRFPRELAFPLTSRTVHLFELLTPSQRREPVPPDRLFPAFTTRYQVTALRFARQVEAVGGRSYNVESRPSAALDRRYGEFYDHALRADLGFFKRPTYEVYLDLAASEESFGRLRDDLMAENLEHFAAAGLDVVARLGRVHSTVRRIRRSGLPLRCEIGPGSYYPEQVLKRRALLGLGVREEDRMRAYVDRLLRIVPVWTNGYRLPDRRTLLSLEGEALEAARDRFDAAARASRSLPSVEHLLGILEEVAPSPAGRREPQTPIT